MAKFTFLELHLDGSTFNAPFSQGGAEGDDEGSIELDGDEDAQKTGAWKPALVGLLFLALIAVVAKKKLGSGGADEDLGDIDDIDA